MLWLYRFFCGFVQLVISGNYSERLINACVNSGISVWHIKKKKGAIQVCVFARDFKRVIKCRGKSGVKIHILSKTGMPFIVQRYKKRPGIAVGAVAFFVILSVLSGYVWNIKVVGNETVDTQSIIASCKKIGIAEGKRIKSIDPQNARVELMLLEKQLSWASVNPEGSCITINVREIKEQEKKDNSPCNLKSTLSGVVVSTTVTKGDVCVKPGDTVVEGQLLVSGAKTLADGSTQFVHSEGKVIVEAVRTFESKVDFEQTTVSRNGNIKTRRVLNFFGLQIPLYLGGIKGEFEKEIETNKITVNGNYAPVYTTTARFFQTTSKKYRLDTAKALEKARQNIEKEIEEVKDIEIISFKDSITQNDIGVILKRECVCRQNAVKEDILLIDTFN